ncbi:SPOR domain-containing protein [Hyphomicrobium facile]|uniref:Sporulation related domain-containing protein n=1 Tax=Hyphomicrobium facile TaxID=51670 RepID=A0A1I7NV44_9HYPH|nr:SPOR domain-containing protein [Hyphomicrobium facile]SFV38527.1 Sporulation related domain-containing protein [Hyphomicrobium facile]
MTQFQVLARPMALAAIATCVFAGGLAGWPSAGEAAKAKSASQATQGPKAGQSGGGDSDAEQKAIAIAAAKKAYDAGLKEYAAGRHQNAIGQLTIAVKAGVLSASEMAKALYTRGLAYKRENKPGLAISDLTSAIWLKNGLSPSDQKSAIAERSEAYRMAGLEDTGSTPDQRVIAAAQPAAGATGSKVVANPAPGPNAGSAGLSAAAIAEAAGGQGGGAGSGDGTSATITRQDANSEAAQEAARARATAAGESSTVQSIASPSGYGGDASPVAAPSGGGSSFGQTVSAIPGNVTGFFSNMFGGGSTSSTAPSTSSPAGSEAVTTASTSGAPETSSWSNATVVAPGSAAAKPTKIALAAETKPKAVAAKGKYKIHIAALRSRADAEALAQNLIAQHGSDLSDHVPTVDEAVIGSMGTFYRVRIGGYASQDEPRGLCNKLRTSGLDCLVVTN